MKRVRINADTINDWGSFHRAFQDALGFGPGYTASAEGWVETMSRIDDAVAGRCTVTVRPGEVVIIELQRTAEFRQRCLAQFEALLQYVATVNRRFSEKGSTTAVALVFR